MFPFSKVTGSKSATLVRANPTKVIPNELSKILGTAIPFWNACP